MRNGETTPNVMQGGRALKEDAKNLTEDSKIM